MYLSLEYANNTRTEDNKPFVFDRQTKLKCIVDYACLFPLRIVLSPECKSNYAVKYFSDLKNKKVCVIYIKERDYHKSDVHDTFIDRIKSVSNGPYPYIELYSFMKLSTMQLYFSPTYKTRAGTKILLFKKYCQDSGIPNELFMHIMSFVSYSDVFNRANYVNPKFICLLETKRKKITS